MQLPKWLKSKGIYETNSVTNGVHRVNNMTKANVDTKITSNIINETWI